MSGWVSTQDRMPPDDAEVLVFTRSGHITLDRWEEQHEDPIGMGGPTIPIGVYWSCWEFEDITHWQPLPEAP